MTWKISNNNWDVQMLVGNRAQINLRPEYQRQLVWNQTTKQDLIWCMLRGQDIPKFYFHIRKDVRPRRWDVIDGQQRVEAIWSYIDNEYHLAKGAKSIDGIDVERMRFNDLPVEMQDALLSYPIVVAEIETNERERVIDQFLSLQRGKPLNGQEKRQARPGFARDLALELVQHDFVKLARINRQRFQQYEAVSKIALWEWNDKIVDAKSFNLDRFYIECAYTDKEPDPRWKAVRDRINKNFNWLHRMFAQPRPELRGINTFLIVYWLGREIRLNYSTTTLTSEHFNQWFDSFCNEIETLRDTDTRTAIAKWASSTNTASLQRERFEFMLRHFLDTLPYL